jgi:hypothetical protein
MKFSTAFFLILPLFISNVAAVTIPEPRLAARQNTGKGRGGGGGGGNNNQNQAGNNGNGGGDPQTSPTLDPRVIAKGFAQNGQNPPVAGQVASLTSTNNFINFCLTVPNLPITDGKQVTTGSCNPAPIGAIPSVDNMPSAKFVFPKNGGTVGANQAFTIQMAIKNLNTGNFVNAQANYFAAPQQLKNGQIVGHSHVVVESLTALDQTTPTDPKKFAFFKGLNGAAAGGVLTADVTAGLPAGAYRLCSINTSSNHQPAIVPVAQHGSLDDCVYFTAGNGGGKGGANNGGANNGGANNGGANNGGANNGAANNGGGANTATKTGAAATATAKGGNGGKNNGGGGRNRRFFLF